MTLLVTVIASPVRAEWRAARLDPVWTLGELADATGLPREELLVSRQGRLVPVDRWDADRPGGGDFVLITRRAGEPITAGVGAIFATWVGATGAIATVVAVAVNLAVMVALQLGIQMLMQALIKPSTPDLETPGPGTRRTISGQRNVLARYEALPQVLGKHRLYPPLAAASYTLVEGGDLYQYAIYTFGYGPLDLSELKIGDEPLFRSATSLVYTGIMNADADAFKDKDGDPLAWVELRRGATDDTAMTLFAADVQEESVGVVLTKGKGWVQRTTKTRTTAIVAVVGWPGGLIRLGDRGGVNNQTVRCDVRYRLVGATAWTDAPNINVTAHTRDSLFRAAKIQVAEGQYEVQVRRITNPSTDAGVTDTTVWVTLLSQRTGTIISETRLCRVALKVRISGRFPGPIDDFNGIAQTKALVWNGAAWAEAATSSPAALYRHVLQGKANARPSADSRIDLTTLQTWTTECTTKGFEFNYVTQGRTTVAKMLENIAAAGRASSAIIDGKFTVVRENDLSGAPVQHFTPRNIKSFEARRRYVELPHAIKMQFVDPDSGYLDTERIVPDDGYTVTSATKFERIDMPGITLSDQAYKLGRYYLAVMRLRPEEYIVETDFEHANLTRGDWVKLTHDVPLFGLASGRITAVQVNGGGDATGVTVDSECTMAIATNYGIRFRRSTDGGSVTANVTLNVGAQTTLVFDSVISAATKPAVGDIFMFGVRGSESVDCVVKEIDYGDDLSAKVTLVDAATAVLTADSGTIPAYNPQISIPPKRSTISKPRVASVDGAGVRSGETRGGAQGYGIRIRVQSGRAATHV